MMLQLILCLKMLFTNLPASYLQLFGVSFYSKLVTFCEDKKNPIFLLQKVFPRQQTEL